MKKNRSPSRAFALCLALGALSLQGCIEMAVVGAGAAALSHFDRRATGAQIDDEGIELRATNRVSERFGDKVHVNITSYNRSVLVTGEVPNEQAKTEIEKIITATPHVRSVTNDLQVAAGTALSSRAIDATITGKVKARFLDANRFNPLLVKVVTENAVVYLMGIVTESEANQAVEVARTTGGVRKVVKVFEYCKPTDSICLPREKASAGDAKK